MGATCRRRCEPRSDGTDRRPAPVIGITRCSRLDDYVASVEQAGGRRARARDQREPARRCVEQIDGLLLTGGGDVDPVLYGEDRHPTVEDAEPGRDEFEIDLARRAMDATCRCWPSAAARRC